MRAFKRYSRGGFTLVELMIVVAIIGVLAALAIYGVRRYLQSAKTSEAKNSIGSITRSAISAYERATTANELLGEGATSATYSHDICASSSQVPAAGIPGGTKYQPNSTSGQDFETGSNLSGWKCLKFSISNPIYFQYHYVGTRISAAADPDSNGSAGATAALVPPAAPATVDPTYTAGNGNFIAYAKGDLDNDSAVSFFSRTGTVNTTTGTIRGSTEVFISQEFE